MQAAFVVAFTTTAGCIGKPKEAAIAAGYSPHTAHEQGRRLVTLPHVKAAIEKANRDQLSGSAATKAIAFLERVVDDNEAPVMARVAAANSLLDRAGISAVRAPVALFQTRSGKPISAMTPTELAQTIQEARQARAELEAKLRDISNQSAMDGPQIDGEAVLIDGTGEQE
jgi:hypothetical protein